MHRTLCAIRKKQMNKIIPGQMIESRDVPYFGKPKCTEFLVNGNVIGYVLVSFLGEFQCWLWHIYVSPKCRKMGYGRQMVRQLKDRFKEIRTEAGASTNSGVRMLRKLGFKKDGDWLVWSASETA